MKFSEGQESQNPGFINSSAASGSSIIDLSCHTILPDNQKQPMQKVDLKGILFLSEIKIDLSNYSVMINFEKVLQMNENVKVNQEYIPVNFKGLYV